MSSSPDPRVSDAAAPVPPVPVAGLRGLVLGWCVWLLLSWLLMMSVELPGPAVYRMVYAGMTGMLLVWPALRLSQQGGGATGAAWTLGEWLMLNLVWQVVAWPLHLIAGWSVTQTVWLDAAVACWSLLTALVIAWGRWVPAAATRTVAMLLCTAIVFGDPLVRLAGGQLAGARWTPIVSLWILAARPERYEPGDAPMTVLAVGGAAVVGWALLAAWCLLDRASRRRGRLC